MNKPALITALAASAIVAMGLSACSSGGSSTPPSAQSVLTSDGYSYDAALTNAGQSSITSTPGFPKGALSSIAVGTTGSNVQIVLVLDSQGLATIAADGAKKDLSGQGLTIAQDGDVVTVTGPLSALSNGG